jgi:hypothetical protein
LDKGGELSLNLNDRGAVAIPAAFMNQMRVPIDLSIYEDRQLACIALVTF